MVMTYSVLFHPIFCGPFLLRREDAAYGHFGKIGVNAASQTGAIFP